MAFLINLILNLRMLKHKFLENNRNAKIKDNLKELKNYLYKKSKCKNMKTNKLSIGIIDLKINNIFSIFKATQEANFKCKVINKKENYKNMI